MNKVTLRPGDYVSTEGMTVDQYHAVAEAFIEAGAQHGEYPEPEHIYAAGPIGGPDWSFGSSGGQLWHGLADDFGGRQLTIEQVLGAGEPETNPITALQEAREAYHDALARVRRELGDGYTLVENVESDPANWQVDDMSNPDNWRVGDVLECVEALPLRWLTDGRLYTVTGRDSDDWPGIIDDDGDETASSPCRFRFHHRPQ